MSSLRPGVLVGVMPTIGLEVGIGVSMHSELDFKVYFSLHFVHTATSVSQVTQSSTAHLEQPNPSFLSRYPIAQAEHVDLPLQEMQLSGQVEHLPPSKSQPGKQLEQLVGSEVQVLHPLVQISQ